MLAYAVVSVRSSGRPSVPKKLNIVFFFSFFLTLCGQCQSLRDDNSDLSFPVRSSLTTSDLI